MELSWEKITIIVGFCAAVVKWGVPVAKAFAEQVSAFRKSRRELASAEITQSVELRRVEEENDKAMWERLNAENKRLNEELKSLRELPSLSFTTKTNWYNCYRELGRKIDRLENAVDNNAPNTELVTRVEDLKRKYDELGTKMP